MKSFTSILSGLGHGLKVFFTDAVKVATVAEPFVEILFPAVAPLFNATVKAIGMAETAAIAAGAQSGTGPQKLAFVVSSLETAFEDYCKTNKVDLVQSQQAEWVSAVVTALNKLPAPPVAVPVVLPVAAAASLAVADGPQAGPGLHTAVLA